MKIKTDDIQGEEKEQYEEFIVLIHVQETIRNKCMMESRMDEINIDKQEEK